MGCLSVIFYLSCELTQTIQQQSFSSSSTPCSGLYCETSTACSPGLPDLSYSTATFLWWSAKRPFTQRPSSSVSYCAVSGRLQPGSKQMADCHNYISESEAQRSESSLESVTERPLRAALDIYSCSHPLRHPWFKGLWRHLWLLKDCSRNWNL